MRGLLLVLLTLAPGPLGTPARAQSPARADAPVPSPAERVRSFVLGLERAGALEPHELAAAAYGLNDLGLAWSGRPEAQREQALIVLDLLGHLIAREREGRVYGPSAASEQELASTAERLLANELDELGRFLAFEVAPMARLHPAGRRAAALRVLGLDEGASARMALFACSRDEARLVRDEAVRALAGRDEPAVHELLLDLLEEAEAGGAGISMRPIERHFAGLALTRTSAVHARVAGYVRRGLTSESWRRASRALAISRCLDDRAVAPMLIETLSVWTTRAAAGLPARRVQGELAGELERRSGRRLGLKPERWRSWWEAVQEGRVTLTGHVEGQASFSRADFFGLNPMTDRVTFVLDRSGSMEESFGDGTYSSSGPGGRTRLREAVSQMSRCLEQLGAQARFGVVLFSDAERTWRRELQPATSSNIAAAGRWVLEVGTGGGTNLRPGIEAAMHVGPEGVDLGALEADTIIVLCDGETSEGAAWVLPFLRRHNDEARVLFHAVRIGGTDDGSLKALCEESGGDFVHVDG